MTKQGHYFGAWNICYIMICIFRLSGKKSILVKEDWSNKGI